MSASPQTLHAFDRLLAPLGPRLSPELARALVDLKADPALQAQLDDFADKNTAGTLTSAEQAEYEALVSAGAVVSALKVQARKSLQQWNGK